MLLRKFNYEEIQADDKGWYASLTDKSYPPGLCEIMNSITIKTVLNIIVNECKLLKDISFIYEFLN